MCVSTAILNVFWTLFSALGLASRIRSNVWTDACYSDHTTDISKIVTFEMEHTIGTFLFNAYIHVLISLLTKFRCSRSCRRSSLLLYWGSSKALLLVVVVRTPLCRVPVACFDFKLNSRIQDQTVNFRCANYVNIKKIKEISNFESYTLQN